MNKKELFEKYFKADMMSMITDKVSNVRMVLAKSLRYHFLNQINGIFLSFTNYIGAFVNDPDVNDAVNILKKDK